MPTLPNKFHAEQMRISLFKNEKNGTLNIYIVVEKRGRQNLNTSHNEKQADVLIQLRDN
jgi:hypothetical protein